MHLCCVAKDELLLKFESLVCLVFGGGGVTWYRAHEMNFDSRYLLLLSAYLR
jgi:hypothetical protein